LLLGGLIEEVSKKDGGNMETLKDVQIKIGWPDKDEDRAS
jgi:hypothetical protein